MPYKQAPKSMALKALIGKQKNLPEALKEKILAAPESAAKQTSDYTGDQFSKRIKKDKAKEAVALGRKIGSKKVERKPVTVTEIPKDKQEGVYIKKVAKKGSEADKKTKKRLSSDKYKSPAKNYKKGYYGK